MGPTDRSPWGEQIIFCANIYVPTGCRVASTCGRFVSMNKSQSLKTAKSVSRSICSPTALALDWVRQYWCVVKVDINYEIKILNLCEIRKWKKKKKPPKEHKTWKYLKQPCFSLSLARCRATCLGLGIRFRFPVVASLFTVAAGSPFDL